MTSLGVFGFVPLGCIVHHASFYHRVLLNATAPLLALALLRCYPLIQHFRGKKKAPATRAAKRLALLLLEVALPRIVTCLVQVTLAIISRLVVLVIIADRLRIVSCLLPGFHLRGI